MSPIRQTHGAIYKYQLAPAVWAFFSAEAAPRRVRRDGWLPRRASRESFRAE
jgi:hypothetical protein